MGTVETEEDTEEEFDVEISASEMTCDIIEEEKQNNSYWE